MRSLSRFVDRHTRKDGIALVLVLGFLSIILLLAVAFTVSMRMERLTARSYIDVVKARHLVDAALTTALDDLDVKIGNNMYPAQRYYASVGGDLVTNDFLTASGGGLPYLPGNSLPSAPTVVQWFDMSLDPGDLTGGLPPMKARVAFLAVDCSGLIDANYAGGATNRIDGTNLQEIAVSDSVLTDLDLKEEAAFSANRASTWYRFESLPELYQLVGSNSWYQPYPTNLFTYSYFPTGYLDSAGAILRPVQINGASPDIAAIRTRLTDLGFPNPQALVDNLADYVDADNVPTTLNSFCTESVPMVNELKISATVEPVPSMPTNLRVVVNFEAELWYPFATSNPNSYSAEIRFRPTAPSPWGLAAVVPLTYSGAEPPWNEDTYAVVTGRLESANLSTNTAPALPTAFQMDIRVKEGSDYVDSVLQFQIETTDLGVGPGPTLGSGSFSKQAIDPRINWDWNLPGQWADNPSPGTMGASNDITSVVSNGDGTTFMYVRNAPIETVGEFGFLLFDELKPWHTIRFLGPMDADDMSNRVLDGFVMKGQTNEHGYVNINTRNARVLAAALVDAPLDRYPGENSLTNMVSGEALSAAAPIMAATAGAKAFTNLSDVASINESTMLTAISKSSPVQAEALVRNSAGLLKTRQQLFTILLAAQVQNHTSGDVLAEQRAVAVVWRDPYPDTNGRHPTFVRSFRWLND